EPLKSRAERVRLESPLRDVAGMLRSFDYLAGATDANDWCAEARRIFLEKYFSCCSANVMPPSAEVRDTMLELFQLEKAFYELRYELIHLDKYVAIPLAGIERL